MSSSSSLFPKEIEAEIQTIETQIFNSMLFLYLDSDNPEEKNDLNNQDTIYNFNELEEINFLSNELIDELNKSDKESENKNEIRLNESIINSLISLAKDGYEFIPKNYKSKNNQNKNNKKNQNLNYENRNRYNKFRTNKKNYHWSFNYINDKVGVI